MKLNTLKLLYLSLSTSILLSAYSPISFAKNKAVVIPLGDDMLTIPIRESSIEEPSFEGLVIDNFESGLRESCSTIDPPNKYFFNHYDGVGKGEEAISTGEVHSGRQSFQETITELANKSNFQFRPTGCSGITSYMREQMLDTAEWQLDTYNRLRFWVKAPPGTTQAGNGNDNMHFGTYTRSTTTRTNTYESGGGHWYHHYNIPYTGEWHQIIVDWHPNSKRGVSGSTEHGEKEYPTDEAGYNYFDLLTRFYVQIHEDFPLGTNIVFDDFEVYEETRQENVNQVYSLNGVYVPSTNDLIVGWNRDKNQNDLEHEVRYAFEDIHSLGFDNATFAINASPLGSQGYNGMEWRTTGLDLIGQTTIYVAIRPKNSGLFRQIEIPLKTN